MRCLSICVVLSFCVISYSEDLSAMDESGIIAYFSSIPKSGYVCKVEAETTYEAVKTPDGKLISLEVPTRLSAIFDGTSPKAFKIKYDPYVVVTFESGKAEVLPEARTIGSDGEILTTEVSRLLTEDGKSYDPMRGGIDNATPAALDSYNTGLFFLFQNLTFGSTSVLQAWKEGQIEIYKPIETVDLDGRDVLKFGLTDKQMFYVDIWLDKASGLSLIKAEFFGVAVDGVKTKAPKVVKGDLKQRVSVHSFFDVGYQQLFFPKAMSCEFFEKDGVLSEKFSVKITSFKIDKEKGNSDEYLVEFKPGTTIFDERLQMQIPVGRPLEDLKNGIKARSDLQKGD